MLQLPLVEGINTTVETVIYDTSYKFNVKWNSRFEYYSMDVYVENVEVHSGILLLVGVDIASSESIPLSRVFCINRNEYNEEIGYTGLGSDGLVVIVEDSDLEE